MSQTKPSAQAPSPLADAEPPRELSGLKRSEPKAYAVGSAAVISSLAQIHSHTNTVRGTQGLTKLNQKGGFDCPSCAWPDPDGKRAPTEFCENGAKALATEITDRRVDRSFFARYSVSELGEKSDYWLNDAGRITEPFLLDEDATHYRPITWEETFEILADELNACKHPDEAIFYTSGRASNEAAFLYQLFVRQFGTNNLPDCSNMCHESSGAALNQTIGIGKGTVTLEDLETTDCVLVVGQNPGTNHPRMLTSLEMTVKNGGRVISVNPLRETGLRAFAHPQKVSGMLGRATSLSSIHLPVKINGDLALFKGLIKCAFEAEQKKPGSTIDQKFIQEHTANYEEFRKNANNYSWEDLTSESGLTEEQIRETAKVFLSAKDAITCWAMGLTQHHNSVEIIREIVNLHLLTGKIGRPKSGLCPVRGHSNVQGDRTMGIWEIPNEPFLTELDKEFKFTSPRTHGYDTCAAIRAMAAGKGRVFFALGGNFLSAAPDTHYTARAMRNCLLTAHVSTKLNRGHLITGQRGLILPCLGRSEIDEQAGGPQILSVENSMGVVHSSKGALSPASKLLLSEPAIVCRLAFATLGKKSKTPWKDFEMNYDLIRDRIEKVIPGFDDFNERLRQPGGFYLPNPVKERIFNTDTGKANFSVNPLRPLKPEPDQLVLQTFRSHDQFNTTVYGMDDRYRGIYNERRVIFLNAEDMKDRDIEPEEAIDIVSHFKGVRRRAALFLAIPYDTPRGSAAAYYPEANVLVPIDSTAETSGTPTSKSILVTLHKRDSSSKESS